MAEATSSIVVEIGDDTSCLYASNNGSELISGHTSLVKLWNITKKIDTHCFSSFEPHHDPPSDVTSICSVNSTTLAVSLDRTVLFFDRNDLSQPKKSFPNCCQDEINHLGVNKKGEFLSACDDSGEIVIINISTGKKFKTCRKHDNICSVALFNERRNWELVSGGLDCHIINWDYSKGKPLSSIDMTTLSSASPAAGYSVNPPMVHALCSIGDNSPLMAAGLGNGCIALINPNKRGQIEVVSMVTIHSSSINTICCISGRSSSEAGSASYDDQLIVSGGNDTKLIISTLIRAPQSPVKHKSSSTKHQPKSHITGIERSKVINHGSKINSCVYSETINRLFICDLTTTISVYDPLKL